MLTGREPRRHDPELVAVIDEITVDCHDEEEKARDLGEFKLGTEQVADGLALGVQRPTCCWPGWSVVAVSSRKEN